MVHKEQVLLEQAVDEEIWSVSGCLQ